MLTRYDESTSVRRLDAKGRKVLAALATDARRTDRQIARLSRTSPDAARYRIARLQELSVLQRIVPCVNAALLGWQRYHIFLLQSGKTRHTDLIPWLTQHPHTESLMEFTDTWDLRWTILARSLQEYDGILRALQAKFGSDIIDKQELAAIAVYDLLPLPSAFDPSLLRQPPADEPSGFLLDSEDMIILGELATNGRMSSYAIAKATSVSNDTVLVRLRKLRASGVIRRISVVCNLAALGYHWYTLALQFSRFTPADERCFREFLEHHPYIIHAERTFGPWDAIIEIIADAHAFHQTVKDIRVAFAAFAGKYETWVAYREHVYMPVPVCITGENSAK